MGRSTKKGPFVDVKLLRKVQRMEDLGAREPIKTWARACTIVPEFVGHTFMVHNGRTHLRVFVTEDMVGHKLGEFSPTRTFRGHSGKRAAMAAAAAAPGAASGAAAPAAGAKPAGPAPKAPPPKK
jgi:small subunit ribosomal protein S19